MWTGSLVLVLFMLDSAGAQEPANPFEFQDLTLRDPAKVVSAESCGECHALEKEVWITTSHATGFKTLHRKSSAETISDRMGFKLIKRESLCLKCHYTAKVEKEQLRAVSGVSCESCHGAGSDWIEVHNNYGAGNDRSTESRAHREQRIAESRAAGMRRPSEIYDTTKSCFECHTVPEEKLVNVGGHSTGSAGFELVQTSQGDIRHNFLGSLIGGSRENRESSPARSRQLYLAGRLLDLEYSLRGMSEASMDGTYAKAMGRRVRNAVAEVRVLSRALPLPPIDEVLARVRSEKIVVGNSESLVALADWIQGQNRTLLLELDGEQLASLDPLIAGQELSPELLVDSEDEAAEEELLSSTTATNPGATISQGPLSAANSASQSGRSGGGIPAVGAVNSFLRPRSSHGVLGPGACSGCHGDQNAWWFDDRHFSSADAFFDLDQDVVRIATLYGIQPSAVARGDSLCMDCHGSVETGKERREVIDGVGCEACHGPAADWLEPHKEGDENLGRNRSGFVAASRLGKPDLESLSVRAENCASCHFINDERLISSGHPTGRNYDFVEGVASIQHWSRPIETRGQLDEAYRTARNRRGPIPTVRLASLAGGDGGNPGKRISRSSVGESGTPRTASERQARILVPRPRDRSSEGSGGNVAIEVSELDEFPEINSQTTVEETLQLLKERLEYLYGLVTPENSL